MMEASASRSVRWGILFLLFLLVGWYAGCTPDWSSSDSSRNGNGSWNCSAEPTTSDAGSGWSNGTPPLPALPGLSEDSPQASRQQPAAPVEEADLVKRKGHLLFYMHPHKGFIIFDQKDPKNPRKLASVPVFGLPVEMFVTDTTAYLLLQKMWVPKQNPLRFHIEIQKQNSSLVSIDIRDLSQPKVLQTLPLRDTIKPGSARKSGDIIYLVLENPTTSWTPWGSWDKQTGQLFLYSINVADPANMKLVTTKAILGDKRFETLPTKIVEFVSLSPEEARRQQAQAAQQSNWSQEALNRVKILPTAPKLGPVSPEKFLGSTISAMHGRLLVTENWLVRTNLQIEAEVDESNWQLDGIDMCGRQQWRQVFYKVKRTVNIPIRLNFAVVNIFDISRNDGQLNDPIRFMIHGALSDQFKQTYINHDRGKLYLAVVRRHQIKVTEHLYWSEVQNTVFSVSIDTPTRPQLLQELPFGKPGETVRGSFFDTSRQVLYAITATGGDTHSAGSQGGTDGKQNIKDNLPPPSDNRPPPSRSPIIDPLYAISFKDPGALKVMSAIDGLSGDIHLFRPIEKGQYLLGVGRDTSSGCNGFDESTKSYSRTAVSLFDVRNLSKIRLVQRKCVVTRPDIKVVTSQLNWDRDQAHKQIGLYEQGNKRLLSVSVRFEVKTDGVVQPRTAIGLMTLDISQDQPGRKPEDQKVLQDLGTIDHPQGDIQRTLWMESPTSTLFLVNLSWNYLVNVSLQDPQNPGILATLHLDPYVEAVYRFGQTIVEQIAIDPQSGPLHKEPKPGPRRWNVRVLSTGSVESNPIVKHITLQNVSLVIRWQQKLLVFRTLGETDKKYVLQWIDFSDPKASTVSPPFELPSIPNMQMLSLDQEYPVSKHWLTTPHGLFFLHQEVSSKEATCKLFSLDLTKPAQPKIKLLDTQPATEATLHYADQNTFFLSSLVTDGSGIQKPKVWGWLWENNAWHNKITVSLPGPLWGVSQDTKTQTWRYLTGIITNNYVSQLMLMERVKDDTSEKLLWLDSLPLQGTVSQDQIHVSGNDIVVHQAGQLSKYQMQGNTISKSYSHSGDFTSMLWVGMQGPYMFFQETKTKGLLTFYIPPPDHQLLSLFWAPNLWWSFDSSPPKRNLYSITSITWLERHILVAAGKLGILAYSRDQASISKK